MSSTSPDHYNVGQLGSASYLADTCVIHDLILRALEMRIDRPGNYPFQGLDIWDLHFYRRMLMAPPHSVTTAVHLATATPDFIAPAIGGAVASLTVHDAGRFNNRLHSFKKIRARNRLASLFPPDGLWDGDSAILDNLVHFSADPMGVLLLLRDALPMGARILLVLPVALDQRMNLYDQLGYVFLSQSDIRSLADDSVVVELFNSGRSTCDWPQYSRVGVKIQRLSSC